MVGYAITSGNPTGGVAAWTLTRVGNGSLNAVSCSSNGRCVVVDSNGNVITSDKPMGGAAQWTVSHVDGSNSLVAASCPSSNFCVAVDNKGNVVVGT